MDCTEKLRDCFDEMVVYKDLKKTNFFLTKEKNWSARQFPVRSSSFIKRFILLCIGCQLGVVFF